MDIVGIIILAIVQGVTEFLPISSSGHIVLLNQVLKIEEPLWLTVLLHIGSVGAIILIIRKEIKKLIKLTPLVIIGSIPVGVVGLLFKEKIAPLFSGSNFVGISLCFTGLILIGTKRMKTYTKTLTPLSAMIIGGAQCLALLPGVSRSGITIATGLYLGISPLLTIKFSLLLGIVSILGAGSVGIKEIVKIDNLLFGVIGFIISFLVSYGAIKILIKTVKKFPVFGIYCLGLGGVLIFLVK